MRLDDALALMSEAERVAVLALQRATYEAGLAGITVNVLLETTSTDLELDQPAGVLVAGEDGMPLVRMRRCKVTATLSR